MAGGRKPFPDGKARKKSIRIPVNDQEEATLKEWAGEKPLASVSRERLMECAKREGPARG